MKQERIRSLWDEVRKLNQQLAAVHREIVRAESDLPEPFRFGEDWIPPYLRTGSCIPLPTKPLPIKSS